MNKKTKPYWKMTTEELRKATQEFDDPTYHPPALPRTAKDRAQLARARRRGRGRPPVGAGARRIQVTMERSLLKRVDEYARKHRLTRARTLALAVQAMLSSAA